MGAYSSGWQIGYPTLAVGETFGVSFEDVAAPSSASSSADTDLSASQGQLINYAKDVAAAVAAVLGLSLGMMMLVHWARRAAL
jgi:hypothetical protein